MTDFDVEFAEFVHAVRTDLVQKMGESAFMMSMMPRGEVDVKFAVELGLAIMLDKPILAVVMPGALINDRMRRVADRVVEVDIDTQAGQDYLAAEIHRFVEDFVAD
jgi:hypothetical protein